MKPTEIYKLEEREIHMMGDKECGVCVAWNMKHERKQLTGEDGVVYSAVVPVRAGKPYIDFVEIRQDPSSGEYYIREDSPVDGGIDSKFAEELIVELQNAIEYMKELGA